MRVVAIVALLTLAGCLAGPDSSPSASPGTPQLAPFVNPIELEHDHADLALHTRSNNIDLVAHSYLGADVPGAMGEIDVAGNHAFVAVFDRGFAIVDISNITNPHLVSVFDVPTPMTPLGRYTADVKADATGDWVFLGLELSEYPGALIVDTRDKSNPVVAGFWASPGTLAGCHMIEYAIINEQEYLFCAPLDNAVYVGRILPPVGPLREIATVGRWIPNSPGYVEREIEHATTDPTGFPFRYVISGHQDMTYQPDPLTGAPTLFVSFWNLGLRIVDVSIPEVPLEIGYWDGLGAEGYRGNFHTAMAFASEERRIVVAIPEGPDPPAMFVIDATDLANPILLSEWAALPSFTGESGASQAGAFSLHNFQIVEGKVYLAMGHGGIWVIDISTPAKQAAPEAVGSYYPHMGRPEGGPYAIYPWDVIVHQGYMLTAEMRTGFYVLHFATDPLDAKHSSFA